MQMKIEFKHQVFLVVTIGILFGIMQMQEGYTLLEVVPILALIIAFLVAFLWVTQLPSLRRIFQTISIIGTIGFFIWSIFYLANDVITGRLSTEFIVLPLAGFLFIIIVVFYIIWFYWSNFLIRLGKPNLAIAHYTNLLRLAPNSPILFSNRALLHLNQANHQNALADYDRAIELVRAQKKQEKASPNVDFRSNLGGLYGSRAAVHVANHDFEAAIADCDTGLAIPDLSPVVQAFLHHNRAVALSELQEYADALIDIESGEEHAQFLPEHQAVLLPMLRSQKALALYQLGRESDAAAVWQALVHAHPNYHRLEWLKNDLKWRDWQFDVAQAILTTLAQQEKSA